jgi:hypothetical protein
MIKYHGDRLWSKVQVMVASILWGLLVAFVAVKVTEGLSGPVQTLVRVVIFLLGFTSLDIGIKREKLDEEEVKSHE